MEIGVFAPIATRWATPESLAAAAVAAEERGFHSMWVPEHVVLFDSYESRYPYSEDGRLPAGSQTPILEPLNLLAFLAANSRTIRLGTGICILPQRNPVYMAKESASVDWLSQGRVDLGLGIGWLAEEFQAVGVDFDRRGDRCSEYVQVMKRLWCDPVSEFHGEFYDLPACRQYPKPVQQPHPPIHFGGESGAALRRVADLGQGWFSFARAPEDVPRKLETLDRLLAERGRTREEIKVSVGPYLLGFDEDAVARYREVGVDQLILTVFARSLDDYVAALDDAVRKIVEPIGR